MRWSLFEVQGMQARQLGERICNSAAVNLRFPATVNGAAEGSQVAFRMHHLKEELPQQSVHAQCTTTIPIGHHILRSEVIIYISPAQKIDAQVLYAASESQAGRQMEPCRKAKAGTSVYAYLLALLLSHTKREVCRAGKVIWMLFHTGEGCSRVFLQALQT